MDSLAIAVAQAADASDPTEGQWLIMGVGMELAAALFYAVYRTLSRTAVGPSGGSVLGGAILMAIGGVVFLVVALVAWISSLT